MPTRTRTHAHTRTHTNPHTHSHTHTHTHTHTHMHTRPFTHTHTHTQAGGEDGTVRVWDLRAPGCQRAYESRAAVNTVVLHPNQGELISGGY
jgi:WD40 repeat protein